MLYNLSIPPNFEELLKHKHTLKTLLLEKGKLIKKCIGDKDYISSLYPDFYKNKFKYHTIVYNFLVELIDRINDYDDSYFGNYYFFETLCYVNPRESEELISIIDKNEKYIIKEIVDMNNRDNSE